LMWEYWLGERYGVTPQEYPRKQVLRKQLVSERYGQTPEGWLLSTINRLISR
jgi:hypothetical protein